MVNNDGTFDDSEIKVYIDSQIIFLREQGISWTQAIQIMKATMRRMGQYIVLNNKGKVVDTWK